MKLEMQHYKILKKTSGGFTIIEMMVAVALFTIIMLLGVGAILNANLVHKKTVSQEAIFDNLNFAMEDMARNMRVGTGFHCLLAGESFPLTDESFQVPQDCTNTANNYFKIAFKGMDYDPLGDVNKNRISYRFWNRNIPPNSDIAQRLSSFGLDSTLIGTLQKSVAAGASGTFLDMTPDAVYIDMTKSGFNVFNAGIVGDGKQPYVEIRIAGVILYKDSATPFALETLVSQRELDATAPSVQ